MDVILEFIARALIFVIQALPLAVVARLGRWGGALVYLLDGRHRRMALKNLNRCFGQELPRREIHALAAENFRRIGENFSCAVRTAKITPAELERVLSVSGAERLGLDNPSGPQCRVLAIGHFGNFELYAHANHFVPGVQFATTYRSLRQPSLDRILQGLRAQSGCLYFERRTEASALREAMNQKRMLVGFLADQHAGDKGLRLPFLGHACSTSAAPAVFALRYHCPLFPAVCYRIALGRWRIEVGEEIPTREDGRPRPVEEIALDVNRAFETAVRRDPANWFWVHNRWKWAKPQASTGAALPESQAAPRSP